MNKKSPAIKVALIYANTLANAIVYSTPHIALSFSCIMSWNHHLTTHHPARMRNKRRCCQMPQVLATK